jgi:hypothetical protein
MNTKTFNCGKNTIIILRIKQQKSCKVAFTDHECVKNEDIA